MARRHGYTDDQLDHLGEFEGRSDFAPQEKSALRFAERMTLHPHDVDEPLWAELRAHFEEGEIVELAAAIWLFNYFTRFNDELKMEPTN